MVSSSRLKMALILFYVAIKAMSVDTDMLNIINSNNRLNDNVWRFYCQILNQVESSKSITQLDQKFLGSIKAISIEGRNIKSLPRHFGFGLQELTLIDLSRNPIGDLPMNFVQYKVKVRCLILDRMRLSYLPADFGNNIKGLDFLSISYNKLAVLPPSFGRRFKVLKQLYLTNNRIKKLPSQFGNGMSNLVYLDLSNNKLQNLPDSFEHYFSNIIFLYLNGNGLRKFPLKFEKDWPGLHTLRLFSNQIDELPEIFIKKIPSLCTIDLSFNKLRDVPKGFLDAFPDLRELYISHNNLRTLPRNILNYAKSLILDIRGNLEFSWFDIPGEGIGLESLRKHFKENLFYTFDCYPSSQVLKELKMKEMYWNFKTVAKIRSAAKKMQQNDFTLADYQRIVEKIKNFSSNNSENPTGFKNLFEGIEVSETSTAKYDKEAPAEMLMAYINHLIDKNFKYEKYPMQLQHREDTLNMMYGIFKHLDDSSDVDVIQTVINVLISAISNCDAAQYSEIKRIYCNLCDCPDIDNSLDQFINFHISDLKKEAFELATHPGDDSENVHLYFDWYLKLQEPLGLPEDRFVPTYLGYNDDIYDEDEMDVKDRYYQKFTPEAAIDKITNKILEKTAIKDFTILNELMNSVYSSNFTSRSKMPSFTQESISERRNIYDLLKEHLRLRGLIDIKKSRLKRLFIK